MVLEIFAILALVLANAFFALSEFSTVASRPGRLKKKQAENKRGAATAQKLRKNPERFLATIQVGITLVGAMLGVFSGATIVSKFRVLLESSSVAFISASAHTIAMILVVLLITVLSVVLGELVPKFIALSNPERYARLSAGPMHLFTRLSSPFSHLLSSLANVIVRALGVRRDGASEQITEDEINQMVLDGSSAGVFEPNEQKFIHSVFEFTDGTVSRAMRPRMDVIAIEKNMLSEKIIELVIEHGYSRYPVFEKTIDNVVGVIYTKDLISKQTDLGNIDLPVIIREPFFVPETMPLPKLLALFQKGRNHMAIVLDEFGGTAGIITLEDVLEELVGEIQDEYDTETAPIVKHSDSILYANGDVWPGDVNEQLQTHLAEEGVDTLAGLFMETTGRLPRKNESVRIADARLTVLAQDEHRILRLRVEKLVAPDGSK